MKIIDIDTLASKEDAVIATKWMARSFVQLPGGAFAPNEALIAFSSKYKTREILKDYGLDDPHITFKHHSSIAEFLRSIVKEIDDKAKEFGMPATGKFRRANHQVLTNREFADISSMGLMPIPAQILGIGLKFLEK